MVVPLGVREMERAEGSSGGLQCSDTWCGCWVPMCVHFVKIHHHLWFCAHFCNMIFLNKIQKFKKAHILEIEFRPYGSTSFSFLAVETCTVQMADTSLSSLPLRCTVRWFLAICCWILFSKTFSNDPSKQKQAVLSTESVLHWRYQEAGRPVSCYCAGG